MKALSGKTLLMWIPALAGWLALGAVLGALGVPAWALLLLDLLATGALLWWIARPTVCIEARGFLLPDREGPSALTPYGNAAAWVSGFGTVGVIAAILTMGQGAFALVAGMVGGLLVSTHLLAPALAQADARSLPDWASARFGARGGRVVRGLLVASGIAIVAVQMGFAALVAEAVGVSPLAILPLVAALVLLAVLAGGLGTMLPAQAALFVVLLAGVLVPALWLGISRTGIPVPHLAPGALLHEIAVAENRLGIARGAGGWPTVALGLTALFGTLALPHTLVRWPVERGAGEARYFAQRGVAFAALVASAVPLFAIAAWADILTAALGSGIPPASLDTAREAVTGGIAALAPPAWLLAALGAGAVAAIVAACASAAFMVASAAGGDPARETAGGVLSRARWAASGAVIAGAVAAMVLPFDPLAAFLALLAIATSALLAPLVLGLTWPRLTAGGALAGLVVGGVWCLVAFALGWSAAGGAALVGLALSASASVAVSLMRRHDPAPAVRKS